MMMESADSRAWSRERGLIRRSALGIVLILSLVLLGVSLWRDSSLRRVDAASGWASQPARLTHPYLGPISPGTEWLWRGYGDQANNARAWVATTQKTINGVRALEVLFTTPNPLSNPKRIANGAEYQYLAQDNEGSVRIMGYGVVGSGTDRATYGSSEALTTDGLIVIPKPSLLIPGGMVVFQGPASAGGYLETTIVRSITATVAHPNGNAYTNCLEVFLKASYTAVTETHYLAPGIGTIQIVRSANGTAPTGGYYRTNIGATSSLSLDTTIRDRWAGEDGHPTTPAQAICADGVSEVSIKYRVSGPGTLTLKTRTSFNGTSAEAFEGSLRSEGSSTYGRTATATAQQSSADGLYYATVYFRAPSDFNIDSASLNGVAHRMDELLGDFNGTLIRQPIRILRPPLALAHGILSDPSIWGTVTSGFIGQLAKSVPVTMGTGVPTFGGIPPLLAPSTLRVFPVDYSSTSGDSFSANAWRVRGSIISYLSYLRAEGIVVEQVDFVGHSMGGILGRIIAAGGEYRTSSYDPSGLYFTDIRTGKGYIHKLVALHSPLLGASTADRVIPKIQSVLSGASLANKNPVFEFARWLGPIFGNALVVPGSNATAQYSDERYRALVRLLSGGAVSDLRSLNQSSSTNEIAKLPAVTTSNVHLMSGELGASRANGIPDATIFNFGLANAGLFLIPPVTLSTVFPIREDGDIVVTGISQRMNLAGGSSGVSSPTTRAHTEAYAHAPNATTVVSLLNAAVSSSSFRTLVANNSSTLSSVTGLEQVASGASAADTYSIIENQAVFKIMAPTGAAAFTGGSTVTSSVFLNMGAFSFETVTFLGLWDLSTETDDVDTPFTRPLFIDTGFVGHTMLYAFGYRANDSRVYMDTVFLRVNPRDSLTQLTTPVSPLIVNTGESVAITVYGYFGTDSNNPARLSGQSVVPINYASESAAVAIVDSYGNVYGVSEGYTQIAVSSGDTQTLVGVQVQGTVASLGGSSSSAKSGGGGCAISRMELPVSWLSWLRNIRDWALDSGIGRQFTSVYYAFS